MNVVVETVSHQIAQNYLKLCLLDSLDFLVHQLLLLLTVLGIGLDVLKQLDTGQTIRNAVRKDLILAIRP